MPRQGAYAQHHLLRGQAASLHVHISLKVIKVAYKPD